MFWCILYYLVAFGTVCCLRKLSAKRAELVQKFVSRSRVRIFRNKHTQSTTLDHNLMFWCILYYLGAFGIVWLPYETRCKTGRSSAKVCATKSRRNFLQGRHPIHPIGPQTEVLVRFLLFACIWDHLVCLTKVGAKRAELVQKFVPRNHVELFAMNAPNQPHWTLN